VNSPSPFALATSDEVVAERLEEVRATIAEIGQPNTTIVAVTKGFDRSAIDCARRLGLGDIGENYAQELLSKEDAIADETTVHFMGRIQRNKVRKIAQLTDVWHSVSRPEIVAEIAKRVVDRPPPQVLIQVRPHDDATKDGVRPDQIEAMLDAARESGIEIAGLMTIGVLGDAAATRAAFAELNSLANDFGLPVRSMGMSGDYRDALEAGATMIRLGSALFGPRAPKG